MEELQTDKLIICAEKTVGEIVAQDYRTAAIFERYGIDFCCGGQQPLSVACRERGIDQTSLVKEIETAMGESGGREQNFNDWSLSFLADYIVNTHHTYLKENMGRIAAHAHKTASVHGGHHPEVIKIAAIFDKISTDMAAHLREEEEVFFPAVRRIEATTKAGGAPDASDIGLLRTSLAKLHQEHEVVGDAVHTIRRLSDDYAIPVDACNTFMLTYKLLKGFEDDLHRHVHLENNILFPKASSIATGGK